MDAVINYVRKFFAQKARECGTRIFLGRRLTMGWIEILDPVQYSKLFIKPLPLLIPWEYVKATNEIWELMQRDLNARPSTSVLFVDPYDIHATFVDKKPVLFVGCSNNDKTKLRNAAASSLKQKTTF